MAQFDVQTVDPNTGVESWTSVAAATADQARDRVLSTGMVIGAVRLKSMDGPAQPARASEPQPAPAPEPGDAGIDPMERSIYNAQRATDRRRVKAVVRTLGVLVITVILFVCAYLIHYIDNADYYFQRQLDVVNAQAAADLREANHRVLYYRPAPW